MAVGDYNGNQRWDPDDLVVGGYRRRLAVCCYLRIVILFAKREKLKLVNVSLDSNTVIADAIVIRI